MNRKLDVITLKEEYFDETNGGEMGWGGVDLVAELKTGLFNSTNFVIKLGKDLGDRTFLIFEAQDGRCFIVYLSLVQNTQY